MRLKRIFLFCLSLFLLTACDSAQLERGIGIEDETIAVVNNKKIPLKRFQTKVQEFVNNYSKLLQQDKEHLPAVKSLVIQRMIEAELIQQEAARRGVQVMDKELQSEVEAALSPYPQAGFERILKQQGLTRDEWVERLRLIILTRKLLHQEVVSRIPITKREINAYYRANRKKLIQPKAIKVKNITLSTLAEANSLRQQLIRKGKIDKAIAQYSISPDRDAGGDMGFVERGELPLEMENAIFALNYQNKVSEVVHSQDGYHIFFYVKYRARKRLRQEEASSLIKQTLIRQKQPKAYAIWMAKLKERATIQIDQEMLQSEEGF